jgi:hypothetical protein
MALVALGVASPAATDQAPAERSETPPQFAVAAERVVVDFVVRDKKREPLRGLTATDVEVYEDGERQAIESFHWVERSRGRSLRRRPTAGRSPRPGAPRTARSSPSSSTA